MSVTAKAGQLIEQRWVLIPLGVGIAIVSTLLLGLKLDAAYYDYWVFPRDKAADGYIYPQLRYTIFDLTLLLWCADGLIFGVVSVRRGLTSRSMSGWPIRALLIYCGLFAALILGGTLMRVARSHGY